MHPVDRCIAMAVRAGSMARALKVQIPREKAGSLIEEVIKKRETSSADP